MTTVNTTITILCDWVKIILTFFLRLTKKYIFLVCCRILVISLCMLWDEKGYKSLPCSVIQMDLEYFRVLEYIKIFFLCPGLCGLVNGAPACEPKGRWFNSQSRAHAWVAGQVPSRGYMRGNHSLMFLCLSFSFPFPL